MGNVPSFSRGMDARVLIAGLDSAGKTSEPCAACTRTQTPRTSLNTTFITRRRTTLLRAAILFKLKRGEKRRAEPVNTIPTLHFNVAQLKLKRTRFSVWDVGGQDAIRPLWRHHFTGTQGVIFVVDSNDRGRVRKAADELHKLILDHALRNACLLVVANKTDLPHALTVDEVRTELQLGQLVGCRAWHVQAACATTGEGLWDGLRWLAANVQPL